MEWWSDFWGWVLAVDPHIWEFFAAIGTLLAVFVSVTFGIVEGVKARRDRAELLRVREDAAAREVAETKAARRTIAGLVTAWITDSYDWSAEAGHHHYERVVTLHLANESNEPVVNALLTVHIRGGDLQIGPLAVPAPVPVVPARREFSWDVSRGIGAFDDTLRPLVELGFTDSQGIRWLRRSDGTLEESTGKEVVHYARDDPDQADAQMGVMDPFRNPMYVARIFALMLWSDPRGFDLATFKLTLDPYASGWDKEWNETEIAALRSSLAAFGNLATFAYYASPRLAYARLFTDDALAQATEAGAGLAVRAQYITLVFRDDLGWRVFGLGAQVRPDEVWFS